jgi:hypothetical protein
MRRDDPVEELIILSMFNTWTGSQFAGAAALVLGLLAFLFGGMFFLTTGAYSNPVIPAPPPGPLHHWDVKSELQHSFGTDSQGRPSAARIMNAQEYLRKNFNAPRSTQPSQPAQQ